jgi:hypothetical protein
VDCPECGTWNPDDKLRCWRCGTTLPIPAPPRKTWRVNAQVWIWIAFIGLLVLSTLVRCAIAGGIGSDSVGWMNNVW